MLLSYVLRLLRVWRRYHATVHELSQFSDHELADLGLTRSQIICVAYRSAWDGAGNPGRDRRTAP
jgi:uncharacterized protein YjiS (DUF1127 family)